MKRYQIPVFLFVNKMDQEGADRQALLRELRKHLDENCVDFSQEADQFWKKEEFLEAIAMCEDAVLEKYLETGNVDVSDVTRLIAERRLFPCFFGSALKQTGVEVFLRGIERLAKSSSYPGEFGAKVYKISRDEQGNRLTHLKITGGMLRVKDLVQGSLRDGSDSWEEKVNQIRIYSGAKYEVVPEAEAGMICAVTGLDQTYPGEGLGNEIVSELPILEPVMNYRIELPEGCDVHRVLQQLRQLEEEEPLLHILWNETLQEIHARIMGEVQTEILKSLIEERFGLSVQFGQGNIVYKETIAKPVEGVGHFEPLRHYAEVHLLLEPGERGSGLQFVSDCSTDILDVNWQRLILTHLEEKEHKGVLSGSPITDMKITLITGRAHQKHTEGGDFRQATYRAVRQGLKKAESVLLEPYYQYRLEVPAEMVGRAMSDLQRMHGKFELPVQEDGTAVLQGDAPVSKMRDYQMEVTSYTRGKGRLSCTLKGYYPCHNAQEVLEQILYDSESDLENPTGSVFCAHGAGFPVKWDQVEEYMHVESGLHLGEESKCSEEPDMPLRPAPASKSYSAATLSWEEEKELQKMIEQAYKPRQQRRKFTYGKTKQTSSSVKGSRLEKEPLREYLLVDGYNIIFSWEELRDLAERNMDGARGRLQDLLSNYQGFKKCTVILVFDAYRLKGYPGEVQKYHNIYVVYTKEAETADQYIEKTAHEIGRKYHVTVATSDATEQVIIRGQGCLLLSATELWEEVESVNRQIREEYLSKRNGERNYLFHYLDEELAEQVEEVRLGKSENEPKNKSKNELKNGGNT